MPWDIPDVMARAMKQNMLGEQREKQTNTELMQHHRHIILTIWLLRQDPSLRHASDRDLTTMVVPEKILTILRHLVADLPASVMAEIQQRVKDPDFILQLHNSFVNYLRCQEYFVKHKLLDEHLAYLEQWVCEERDFPEAPSRRMHALVHEISSTLGEISQQIKDDFDNFQNMGQLEMKHRRLDNAAAKVRKVTESFMKSWREEVTKAAGHTTSEWFLNWFFTMTKRLNRHACYMQTAMDVLTAMNPGLPYPATSPQLQRQSDGIDADIQALRSQIDEAKRLFDADRTLARVRGQLEEFDQRRGAGEEGVGWDTAKYSRKFHHAYVQFLEKWDIIAPSSKFFPIAVEGVAVPDVFAEIEAGKEFWLSNEWKKHLKVGLCQRMAELEATREVFWHPTHFLESVIPGMGNGDSNQPSAPRDLRNGTSSRQDPPSGNKTKRNKNQKEKSSTENNGNDKDKNTASKDYGASSNSERKNGNHKEKVAFETPHFQDEGNMAKGKSKGNEHENVNKDEHLPSKPLRHCSSSLCGKSKLKSEVFVCAACVQHASLPNSHPFKKAYYCDATCQISDWKERHSAFHKKLSKEWKRLNRQCSYTACRRRAADHADNAPKAKLHVCPECRDYASDKGFQKAYYCDDICRLADWEAGHAKIHEELERKCQIVE